MYTTETRLRIHPCRVQHPYILNIKCQTRLYTLLTEFSMMSLKQGQADSFPEICVVGAYRLLDTLSPQREGLPRRPRYDLNNALKHTEHYPKLLKTRLQPLQTRYTIRTKKLGLHITLGDVRSISQTFPKTLEKYENQ